MLNSSDKPWTLQNIVNIVEKNVDLFVSMLKTQESDSVNKLSKSCLSLLQNPTGLYPRSSVELELGYGLAKIS